MSMYRDVRVKVFKFEVSNSASAPMQSDLRESWYYDSKADLYSPSDVENAINTWIRTEDALVIDIDVKNVDVKYHNNARGNTIQLWYTITYYKEEN